MSDLDLRKLANQSSQPISTTSFCPILTMLQSKPNGYNPLDHELNSLQKELEILLLDSANRYNSFSALLGEEQASPVPINPAVSNFNEKSTDLPISASPTRRSSLLAKLDFETTLTSNKSDKNRSEHAERFWSAVAEFTGEVPSEALQMLNNLSEINQDDPELQLPKKKKPKRTWDNLLGKIESKPIKLPKSSISLPQSQYPNQELDIGFGMLSERIVGALIDSGHDEVSGQVKKMMQDIENETDAKNTEIGKEQMVLQNLADNRSAKSLEKRIAASLLKENLISSGKALQALSDSADPDPENSIDEEIDFLRSQLRIVQTENATTAKILYDRAIQHNTRHRALKKLENLDFHLLDIYKKLQNARYKRKPLSKKEKEQVATLLDKRREVLSELPD